jgi:predicted DNA-binding transcriptional regulator AlpA
MANALPEAGFVRLPQILELIPVSRSSWWAGVKAGKYPPGVKLGPRTTAWRAEDIRSLIEKLGAAPAEEKPAAAALA